MKKASTRSEYIVWLFDHPISQTDYVTYHGWGGLLLSLKLQRVIDMVGRVDVESMPKGKLFFMPFETLDRDGMKPVSYAYL